MQNIRQPQATTQQVLTGLVLQPLLERRRPKRVLVLKHANADNVSLELVSPAQIICLETGEASAQTILHCRLESLPFDQDVFDIVVLQHLVSDGSEAVLDEAVRVLTPAGDLLISGLNWAGSRYRFFNRKKHFPGIRLTRLIYQLKSHSFNLEHLLTMGLAGLSRPAAKGAWYGLTMPFADRVVLHGHHQATSKNANILGFKRVQPAGMASVAIDGCSSRKAAS